MKETYIPTPIDTTDVILTEELLALVEQLAENTHDVWAAERIRQGWRYGPQRDDQTKQTPCLIPYHDLPEDEKVFDRNTAMETVRLLLKLGWQLTPSAP